MVINIETTHLVLYRMYLDIYIHTYMHVVDIRECSLVTTDFVNSIVRTDKQMQVASYKPQVTSRKPL